MARCNTCMKLLTKHETETYDLIWQHSGDMYCTKHRSCPDDCRREPCRLVALISQVIADPVGHVGDIVFLYNDEVIQAAKDLGRSGKWSGGTWELLYWSHQWVLNLTKEVN